MPCPKKRSRYMATNREIGLKLNPATMFAVAIPIMVANVKDLNGSLSICFPAKIILIPLSNVADEYIVL